MLQLFFGQGRGKERNISSRWRGILVRVDWVKMTRKWGEIQKKLDLV